MTLCQCGFSLQLQRQRLLRRRCELHPDVAEARLAQLGLERLKAALLLDGERQRSCKVTQPDVDSTAKPESLPASMHSAVC